MLMGIPPILGPELMKVLLEMGHGDEIVLADGNFPAASCSMRLIRCDGHGVTELLDAILKFFPLDNYSEHAISLMKVVEGDPVKPDIWDTFRKTIDKHVKDFNGFKFVDRFDFYDRSKNAYAIVATSESALYANIILKKGVVAQ